MAPYKRKDKIYVYKREFFDNDVDFKLLFVNEYYGLTARQLSDRVSILQKALQKDSIFVYWVLSHPLDQDTKDHRSPSGVDDQFVLPF